MDNIGKIIISIFMMLFIGVEILFSLGIYKENKNIMQVKNEETTKEEIITEEYTESYTENTTDETESTESQLDYRVMVDQLPLYKEPDINSQVLNTLNYNTSLQVISGNGFFSEVKDIITEEKGYVYSCCLCEYNENKDYDIMKTKKAVFIGFNYEKTERSTSSDSRMSGFDNSGDIKDFLISVLKNNNGIYNKYRVMVFDNSYEGDDEFNQALMEIADINDVFINIRITSDFGINDKTEVIIEDLSSENKTGNGLKSTLAERINLELDDNTYNKSITECTSQNHKKGMVSLADIEIKTDDQIELNKFLSVVFITMDNYMSE